MFKRIIHFVLLLTLSCSADTVDKDARIKPVECFSFYSGSGHGGSLEMMKFQKLHDGTYSVLFAAVYSGSMMSRIPPRSKWPDDAYAYRLKKALINEESYQVARKACVAGLDASQEVSEQFGEMSTNDFLTGLRMDDGAEVREKAYCDYSNSAKTPFYGPLGEASRALAGLAKEFQWQVQEDEELVDFVTETLEQFYPRFAEGTWWWVEDRLIKLSGRKGNVRAIPLLVKLMLKTRRGIYSDTKSINERELAYLVTALDEITGQGFRFDANGEPRPLNDVVKDYFAEYAEYAEQAESEHQKTDDRSNK